jgi:putative Ca2+/H+ antiporter (TMEM165/GDT1 family)
MEAFAVSTLAVALAEFGDRTQLLAIVLAARFRKPWPIAAGILAATLVNHGASAWIGEWAGDLVGEWARWIVGLSFLAMAVWILIPDKDGDEAGRFAGHGAFVTTLVLFFLVELGDKTQIATMLLAARFESVLAVATGTTLGMMLANVPAVWLGDRLAPYLKTDWFRRAAAAAFLALGLAALAGWMV